MADDFSFDCPRCGEEPKRGKFLGSEIWHDKCLIEDLIEKFKGGTPREEVEKTLDRIKDKKITQEVGLKCGWPEYQPEKTAEEIEAEYEAELKAAEEAEEAEEAEGDKEDMGDDEVQGKEKAEELKSQVSPPITQPPAPAQTSQAQAQAQSITRAQYQPPPQMPVMSGRPIKPLKPAPNGSSSKNNCINSYGYMY